MSTYSYLALGDSYTIGEGVPLHESFPYQLTQKLRTTGYKLHAPEIVAKTGWTTFELKDHISHTQLNKEYDFVTLLIGVNNQYRGLPIDDYKTEFDFLIQMSLQYVDKPSRMIVLSVPDWGATPFAEGRELNKIAGEIDEYNKINKEIALAHGAAYLDITTGARLSAQDGSLLTEDKLHYSGKEYKRWAEQVAEKMIEAIEGRATDMQPSPLHIA